MLSEKKGVIILNELQAQTWPVNVVNLNKAWKYIAVALKNK